MTWQNTALGLAGAIGAGTAVVHGILTQRLMVTPIEALFESDGRTSAVIRRVVPLALHFSTVVWFLGGLALIAAALWFDQDARRATGLLVGGTFLLGALGNLWATRGHHPGWMLMAAAVILIAFALGKSASQPDEGEGRAPLTPKIERFQPEGMHVRISNGQPSYSHVVTVSGAGKIVYTAGQLARDIDGNCVGKGDMRAQLEQTFRNLDRCLKAAGATWADVVKTNTFVTDFDEFQKCADVRMRYIGVATPTSTTVGVTRLAGPDFMVEIEAVAVVPA